MLYLLVFDVLDALAIQLEFWLRYLKSLLFFFPFFIVAGLYNFFSLFALSVTLSQLLTAARALDVMNFTPLNWSPIQIMYSHRDASVRKSKIVDGSLVLPLKRRRLTAIDIMEAEASKVFFFLSCFVFFIHGLIWVLFRTRFYDIF